LGGEHDVDSDDEDDDAEDARWVHSDRRQAPTDPSGAPPRTADASSFGAMGPSLF